MSCPGCGKQIEESDAFCRSCGRSLSVSKPALSDAAQITSLPATVGPPEQPRRRSREATVSLILGLFSFIPVAALLAVIFGHLGRASVRRAGGRLLGNGMAFFGLLLGYVGLAGWLTYGMRVLVHPLPPSTRMAENERLAVGSLRVINAAALAYASIYNGGFPPTLKVLGPPKGLKPTTRGEDLAKVVNAQAAGLIDEVLASGTSGGYRFTYTPGKIAYGRLDEYSVRADPLRPGESGRRHFFMNENGVIREEMDTPARKESPLLGHLAE